MLKLDRDLSDRARESRVRWLDDGRQLVAYDRKLSRSSMYEIRGPRRKWHVKMSWAKWSKSDRLSESIDARELVIYDGRGMSALNALELERGKLARESGGRSVIAHLPGGKIALVSIAIAEV